MRNWVPAAILLISVLGALARPCGADRAVIELRDGSRIEGEVLKKDARMVHVLLAEHVVSIDRKDITQIKSAAGGEEGPKEVKRTGLYVAGRGTVKSIPVLARELAPAVVSVETPSGSGTGWFCSPDGYVVTNQHVIAGEQAIRISAYQRKEGRFEKKEFKKVKIVALDEHMDLALLKIEEQIDIDIPQLIIGDSTKLKEGDTVFTIGNPMGLERSTSQGIVSKVNRAFTGRLYVQTTAPISPGNSGGPLFNERGEVIGVTNMGYVYLDGLGFAVPSVYVKEFLDNVESFAYDPGNPNSGVKYMDTPLTSTDGTLKFTACDFIKVGAGVSCLKLADINADGVEEVLFANNNKGEIGVLRRRKEGESEQRPADFEDINRLPESKRFKLLTYPINNSISSLAVADMNGDGRPDILFYGDVDGLAVMDQREDGSFADPRRLADVDVAKRDDALRIADIDGDGKPDVFALGTKGFTVLRNGREKHVYPLDASYRDEITELKLLKVNGDDRLDLVLFCADQFHAAHVLLQGPEGDFVEDLALRCHLSGPVKPYEDGSGALKFLALDKGQNRVRKLSIGPRTAPRQEGRINVAVTALALQNQVRSAEDFQLADLDGDGRAEIVTVDASKCEFLVFHPSDGGMLLSRSPAPKGVSALKLMQLDKGHCALFSLSPEDKLFGVSRVDVSGVSYPRPINTEGQVQFVWLGRVDGPQEKLVWVEKVGSRYAVRSAPAATLARFAFDGREGSIDAPADTLKFGKDESSLSEELPKKPQSLAFADFNADGEADLVIYWAYSGKESLYAGMGKGRFRAVIAEQEFLKLGKEQPLLVADIDGDRVGDVLLVQPGFVRVLKVDRKDKLYVEKQFNYENGPLKRLVPYSTPSDGAPLFLALSGNTATVIRFDVDASKVRQVARVDLSGLQVRSAKARDMDGDGTEDIVLLGGNVVQVLYVRDRAEAVESENVFDARLDNFTYWNLRPADLDGDGKDEVMLFDSKKAMFEVYRPGEDGSLRPILRRRVFEKTILQQQDSDTLELPKQVGVGDVDGNGKADLVFILQDRVALYLQDARG